MYFQTATECRYRSIAVRGANFEMVLGVIGTEVVGINWSDNSET
jgi:hypothetical protein